MKILYVDQTGQLGGGELAILPWLHAHPDGATVALFEDGPFRRLIEDRGVPVILLAQVGVKNIRRESGFASILSALPGLIGLRSGLARLATEFDVLYANSQKAFLLSALARRRGQPLVWHLRDILTAEHFSPLLRKIAILFGNHFATVIICNSRATSDAFIAAGGRSEKTRVVHDGVSHLPFDNIAEAKVAACRAEIGSGSQLNIGVFGRLSPWKGQQILLEAVSQIPNAHAVLVGDALFGETDVAAMLQARARMRDLAGRVHFLGFRTDVPALMKAMDIIVHTSTAAEPFGLVIVEGMLARRPVIATRAGGAMEIVDDKQSGLLVTPGSVTELTAAISFLLQNPTEAQRIAASGRARALGAFSVEALAEGISNVLRELTPRLRVDR